MIMEMIISQAEFWVVFILSVGIAHKFYQWKDGRLRVILIWLFIAMAVDFGANGLYYALWDFHLVKWDEVILRDITHLPKMMVMIALWRFMRK